MKANRHLSLITAISLACLSTSLAQSPKPRPGHPHQAAAFEAMRLRNADGTISTNGLINAIKQARQMQYNANAWPGAAGPKTGGIRPLVADLNTNNWEWLGPGNVGGRIRSILVHPTATNIMWIGSVGGGVWKTTNSAASWFPCDDWMANIAIGCMVLDPTDPNVLYAGTGEDFPVNNAIPGAGVFKSIDGGSNWTRLTNTSYALLDNINRLAICPTNHLILLAATGNGLWHSDDGGTNWTQTYTNAAVKQVAFHPTDGSRAIATPDGLGLYSTNGGLAWTPATGLATTGRIEFAYAPSSPNLVYASQDTNGGSLFLSTNGGVTYTLKNTGQTNLANGQGDFDNCIWVDPTNPTNLIIGGVDLFRSTNGGMTLTPMSDWNFGPGNNRNVVTSAHADHHAIVSASGFNGVNNTTVFFGNDGGLACATNVYTVTTTNGWSFLNNNLGITQLYGAAANPTTFTTVCGNQDNGSTSRTATSGTTWITWSEGDGGFCAADPTDPNYFYGEYINLQIYRSSNGAVSESAITTTNTLPDAGVPAGYDEEDPNAPTAANFIAPFILDPNNPNTMLAGGSNLWRSVNVKAAEPTSVTWTNIKSGADTTNFISAIAVAKGNSDIIWVGHNESEVYSTTNGTATNPTWTQKYLNTPNLPSRVCTRLAIDPNNSSIVYATFGGFSTNNVYRTTDDGLTWTNIAGGLPAAPVYSIVIAPFNSSYLYVGTEVGIFGSANSGASWSPANEGPANVQVQELFWARNYLYAATHGRGAYRIALGPPTVVVSPAVATGYRGFKFTFTASAIGTPTLNYQWQYDGNNIFGATSATFTITNAQPTNGGLYRVIVSNGEGIATSSVSPLAIISSPPYRTQTLAAGPVAYWRLNEAFGLTAYDSAGGNDGTIGSTVVLGANGPTAPAFPGFEAGHTAFQFNGIDASVTVPALNLNTNTVTITAWINYNGGTNSSGIFSWQGTGDARGQFLFDNGGTNLSCYWNGDFQFSDFTVPTNLWTFVALVVSPTHTLIYMATNSTLAAWSNPIANAAAAFNSTALIGDNPYGRFNGAIDEVAVYNQSLTASQISNLLSAATTALPVVTLTAPADGSSFSASSNILLTASVATNGHAIGNVQFYNGAALLSQSTTPPYQFTWSGATTGIHTLLAQVTYDGSSTISSLPANITVTNAAITVNTTPTNILAKVSGTNLTLSWPADHIGWRLLTQTNNLANGISGNMNDWGTVANSASTNLVTIPINPTKPTEFYRLIYP
jgi:hypothetical protein